MTGLTRVNFGRFVNLNREVNTMKKIFIILSVLSLFVGCASNKAGHTINYGNQTFNEEINSSETENWEETLWNRFELSSLLLNYTPGSGGIGKREYEAFKRKVFEICNSKEISIHDWYVLKYIDIINHDDSYYKQFFKEFGSSDKWFEEILFEKNFNNNNFTGKIINNSDDLMRIRIISRNDYNPIRCFYLEIPAHKEKEFAIPNVLQFDETRIGMEILVSEKRFWCDMGTQSREARSNYAKFCQYCFSNYSFELTYNDFEKTYKTEDMLSGNSIKYSRNWKLVPHYEVAENILVETDYQSLNKYFGNSAK